MGQHDGGFDHGRCPPARSTPGQARPKAKPFPGLTQKPHCAACEAAAAPPLVIQYPSGRPREVDTDHHYCPNASCAYYGWIGRGKL